MCLYPKLIKNRRYTANKKNGGNIPPVSDIRTLYVPVGCGNCMECRKQKGREWQVRMMEEIKTNRNGKMITLTLSDESYYKITKAVEENAKINDPYEKDNTIATWGVRHWLERHRKEHKKSIRHWLITELGHEGTENIHIHGIVWIDNIEEIEKHWQYGRVWTGENKKLINGKITKIYNNYVNEKTVNYMIKYVTKMDVKHIGYKGKILTSAGIGNKYTETINAEKNKYKSEKTNETYRTRSGTKMALPIYYRNKIYTEKEREKLWLEKLDKEERYILGQKISIKKGQEEYEKALKNAREKNNRLKYGSNERNEEEEQYARERRLLMQQTRIAKGKKKTESTSTPVGRRSAELLCQIIR